MEPVLGGGDALLQVTHLGGQRGLVAYGGGHTAQQCGHLGTGLGEAEDVVHEQKHVLALIAEVLGLGQAGQTHAQTGSRRLVHLAVDQAGLVDNAGLAHLQVQVGTLAGALAHAGEHRGAAVLLGQVVDELLDDNGLADASAAEQARLAALDEGLDQVDGLDAGLEDLGLRGQVVVRRGRDGGWACSPSPRAWACSSTGSPITFQMRPRVSGPTGIMMGCTGVGHLQAADEAVGGASWLPSERCCRAGASRPRAGREGLLPGVLASTVSAL